MFPCHGTSCYELFYCEIRFHAMLVILVSGEMIVKLTCYVSITCGMHLNALLPSVYWSGGSHQRSGGNGMSCLGSKNKPLYPKLKMDRYRNILQEMTAQYF